MPQPKINNRRRKGKNNNRRHTKTRKRTNKKNNAVSTQQSNQSAKAIEKKKQVRNDPFSPKHFGRTGISYVGRINILLDEYAKFIQDADEAKTNDVYELVASHYPNSKISYFVSDYGKYVENMDDNNICHTNTGLCEMENCDYIQREYRNRGIYDKNNHDNCREKLYHNAKSEESIVLCQLLDQLHINKHHLVDIGLRYIAKDDQKHDSEQLLNVLTDELCSRQQRFNAIRNDFDKSSSYNKFVTNICTQSPQDAEEEMSTYSSGIRFYYHKYYKNNHNTDSIIPDKRDITDQGNPPYTHSDWYIKPKYASIKDEVLNSETNCLSMTQFKNTLLKAKWKLNSFKNNITKSLYWFATIYGIRPNSSITLNHILSVLLYTNHTLLSAEFSKSFRRLSYEETEKSLIKRHSKYAIWAKYLREVIDCWGTYFTRTDVKLLYHGISRQMLFSGFKQRFCAPTSTTLIYETAVMFSKGEGIVISIKNCKTAVSFFDCIKWSDFAGESEMLFCGGFHRLEINGLTSISDGVNYDKWIQSIKIFQIAMFGHYSYERVTNEHASLIRSLIFYILQNKEVDMIKPPQYIAALFTHLLDNINIVIIDIGLFNKDLCGSCHLRGNLYGYQKLKYLFFNAKGEINFERLQQLFSTSNLNAIRIMRVNKIPKMLNGYKWSKSVLITDTLLNNIISYISKPTLPCASFICFNYPQNTNQSLQHLIRKYSIQFAEYDYALEMQTTNSHYMGSCDVFCCKRLKI